MAQGASQLDGRAGRLAELIGVDLLIGSRRRLQKAADPHDRLRKYLLEGPDQA
jgi:hypothetical protein